MDLEAWEILSEYEWKSQDWERGNTHVYITFKGVFYELVRGIYNNNNCSYQWVYYCATWLIYIISKL